MHAAASGPVLQLLAASDDNGILQSCCEYWRYDITRFKSKQLTRGQTLSQCAFWLLSWVGATHHRLCCQVSASPWRAGALQWPGRTCQPGGHCQRAGAAAAARAERLGGGICGAVPAGAAGCRATCRHSACYSSVAHCDRRCAHMHSGSCLDERCTGNAHVKRLRIASQTRCAARALEQQ